MFPPRDMDEKYIVLPFFWVPEDTIPRRVKANSVPYDVWEKQGHILATEGNVIHYDFIEKFIYDLAEKYHILEIAVDRWNATQMKYKGINRLLIQKEEPFNQGYAICFENIVRYVNALLPSNEDVNAVQLSTTSKFPLPSVREAIANSLIHQDLYITGAAPVVEIFDNRIEVTNPGTPLVDILRIIDNPPKSRNENRSYHEASCGYPAAIY